MVVLLLEKYHGPMAQPAGRISLIDTHTCVRLKCQTGLHANQLGLWLPVLAKDFPIDLPPFDVVEWLTKRQYDDYWHQDQQLVVAGLWQEGTPIPTDRIYAQEVSYETSVL